MGVIHHYLSNRQEQINTYDRKRLKNTAPTIIASNCTGGFLYHWLGLQFRSPFINLYMTPVDFVDALENFDGFLETSVAEDKTSEYPYPVGVGYGNTKIHFVHYATFEEALSKWEERKIRIDRNNMGIVLSNWEGSDIELLKKFDTLPFKNKVVFVDREIPEIKSAVLLKGYHCHRGGDQNVYRTQNVITGKRYIDQFDYVEWINSFVR